MIDFTPLASSSRGNAYIVDDGQTQLLLEAGIPIKELRRRSDHGLSKIDACFCGHAHLDHCRSAAEVMRAGIELYCPQDTADAMGLSGHRLHIARHNQQVNIGTLSVVPFDVPHDVPNLGFLIANRKGERLLFAVDCHYIPHRFRNLSVIAIECNFDADLLKSNIEQGLVHPDVGKGLWGRHMSLQEVKRFLAAQDLRAVNEIHLLHLSEHNSDAEMFQSEIERKTGKPCYVAAQ